MMSDLSEKGVLIQGVDMFMKRVGSGQKGKAMNELPAALNSNGITSTAGRPPPAFPAQEMAALSSDFSLEVDMDYRPYVRRNALKGHTIEKKKKRREPRNLESEYHCGQEFNYVLDQVYMLQKSLHIAYTRVRCIF